MPNTPKPIVNWIFNVGLPRNEDYERYADVLREAILAYDFVTDVMDYEEEDE